MSKWVETDAQWYEERMFHCSCCGRLIAKHLLVADAGGEQKLFCSEGCEQLYRDYILVKRGRNYRPVGNVWKLYEERMVK
jgi:hypothetical protein